MAHAYISSKATDERPSCAISTRLSYYSCGYAFRHFAIEGTSYALELKNLARATADNTPKVFLPSTIAVMARLAIGSTSRCTARIAFTFYVAGAMALTAIHVYSH